MKIVKFNTLVVLVALFAFVTGCKDDSDDPESPFIGNYVISQAQLAEALSLETNQVGVVPVPAGTDITVPIQTALLSSVNCSSADKAFVELRKDFSMYMSCEGQNELDAGTWIEVDNSTLILNMNTAAIPSSPTGMALTVTDIVKSGNTMTGTTSVPLPKEMVAVLITPLTLTAATPAVINVVFQIKFIKQ